MKLGAFLMEKIDSFYTILPGNHGRKMLASRPEKE
jgi:hypothetical protein